MYHCYFLINYIGPPKVFFSFPLAPSLKSLPITELINVKFYVSSLVRVLIKGTDLPFSLLIPLTSLPMLLYISNNIYFLFTIYINNM